MQKQPAHHPETKNAIEQAKFGAWEDVIMPLDAQDLETTYANLQERIKILERSLAQVGFELEKNDSPFHWFAPVHPQKEA